MTDDPLRWPIDVFRSTLDDLTLFENERAGVKSNGGAEIAGKLERIRRKLKRRGIPPLFVKP